MAFIPIDSNKLKVGDPITKDILDLIKSNFDDLDTRVNSLATSTVSIYVLNGDISFYGFSSSDGDLFYYKARQNISVNDFKVQLFSKQGITSGSLVLDLQKSTDTNDSNFSSILSSVLTFNFSIDADYVEKTASINSLNNSLATNSVLRIKVTSVPFGFTGKILVSIGAQ